MGRSMAIALVALTAACGGARTPVPREPVARTDTPTTPAPTQALGDVRFESACSADAQPDLDRAVGLLHHMMYSEAEAELTSILEREPDCAMAHWGIAMSLFHPLWPVRTSPEALERGLSHLETARRLATTERERAYVEAALGYYEDWQTVPEAERLRRWADRQAELSERMRDDLDAASLHALALLAIAPADDRTYAHQRRAAEILAEVHERAPRHPGAIHYGIHAHDFPGLAAEGVRYAEAYEAIAPDVPHAAHMPSHLYIRIGDWERANEWNYRSRDAAVEHAVGGTHSMHWVHAADYLVFGHLQLLQDQRAREVLEDMRALRREDVDALAAFNYAAAHARYPLERREWAEAAELYPERVHETLAWSEVPESRAVIDFARGLGAARVGRLEAAREARDRLDEAVEVLRADTRAAATAYWARRAEIQRDGVEAWIAFAEGDRERALELLRSAADREEALGKSPAMPGYEYPARDLLGEMLLETGDARGALEAFERSLEESPNRPNALASAATAARELGETQMADRYARELASVAGQRDTERPILREARGASR